MSNKPKKDYRWLWLELKRWTKELDMEDYMGPYHQYFWGRGDAYEELIKKIRELEEEERIERKD